MKRRTKLTPFAKIVILGLVFLGARYAYLHQDEILEMEIFNPKDTTETVVDIDTDIVTDKIKDIHISPKDTIDLYLTRVNNSIRIQTSDTIVEINSKDTLIYTVSEKDNLIGRIILN